MYLYFFVCCRIVKALLMGNIDKNIACLYNYFALCVYIMCTKKYRGKSRGVYEKTKEYINRGLMEKMNVLLQL